MSMPAAQIRCTKCEFRGAVPRRPITLEYVLPDGSIANAYTTLAWCPTCGTVTEAEEPLDVGSITSELSLLPNEKVGFLGKLLHRRDANAEEREQLRAKLWLATIRRSAPRCLTCGTAGATPVHFDENGLSGFVHSCGGRLYLAPDDPNAPRFYFRPEVIRLDPDGQRIEEGHDPVRPSRANFDDLSPREFTPQLVDENVNARDERQTQNARPNDDTAGRVPQGAVQDMHAIQFYLSTGLVLLGDQISDPNAAAGVRVFTLGMVDMLRQIRKLKWNEAIAIYSTLLTTNDLLPSGSIGNLCGVIESQVSHNKVIERLMRQGAESVQRYITEHDSDAPIDMSSAAFFAVKNATELKAVANA